jgi:hypothetical protein
MVVNFRVREISRGIYKVVQTPTLIIIKKYNVKKRTVNLFLIVFKENYNTIEKSEKIEKRISIFKVCLK